MNSYIKHIVEAFDFNSINKQKKSLNAHDILFDEKLNNIIYKIINKPTLGIKDKNFILSLPPLSYKTNDDEIHLLIEKCMKFFGDNCNLNWIDTSEVTDMSKLFFQTHFNGDISLWNVSNVTNMSDMFENTTFNGDISKWDVSNVRNMNGMFQSYTHFNSDISLWDVSNVTDMSYMFSHSKFNKDISQWNVSNVTDMSYMFWSSKFNGDISLWNVSSVNNMQKMFDSTEFNRDISLWDVSNVTNMACMFKCASFNGNISNWNINSNCDMSGMFWDSEFNKDISNWRITANCNTLEMFSECHIKKAYKPKISNNIITSKLNFSKLNNNDKDTINILFDIVLKIIINKKLLKNEYNLLSSFNSIYIVESRHELIRLIYYIRCVLHKDDNINLNWIDTSNITDMSYVFGTSINSKELPSIVGSSPISNCYFNGDISLWDVSNVTNMEGMFMGSVFNGDISKWDVSNVTNMKYMFCKDPWNVDDIEASAEFNGDISLWDVSNVVNMESMFLCSKFFNKDISNWKINRNCNTNNMFLECIIADKYKPKALQK